jgi:sulfur-oxidizing protein SoxY
MQTISRRKALQFGAGLTLSLLAVEDSSATPAEADAEIAKFTGGQPAESGKIAIDLPDIAENGNTVPLSIKIDSPMNAGDYVSDILIVTDGNPYPGVARFQLTPMSGRAEAATRIRLNTTENVIVVAKTSTGKIFADRRLVKVTVGGCGG